MAADVLAQLLEASWRGISFPTTQVETDGSHNVVQHRRQDRDGWRVENTGRNSYVFRFRIPFINTIAHGDNETWDVLYPVTYRRMLTALEDRTSGPFQHPDYGTRNCKVATYKTVLDPEFRGGPTMAVELYETVDDGDAIALDQTSTLAIAAEAAYDLDAEFLPLTPPPDTGTPGGISLTDFIKSLGAIADEWDLFKMQIAASINRVTHALEVLEEKFGGEPGFSDKTERLISALHAYRQQGLQRARPVSLYIVPRRTTLAAIAQRLRSSVPDLIRLNPELAASLIVPAQTAVRYYG
jgi:prophage DNA circulation protein